MRKYFENLMKPLLSNESLEDFLSSFQEKIIKRFEEKYDDQNKQKITIAVSDSNAAKCFRKA